MQTSVKQYFSLYEILGLRNFTNWSEEFPLKDEAVSTNWSEEFPLTDEVDSTNRSEEFPLTDEVVSAERRKLYLAALNGDWKSVKDMPNIQRKITNKGETTLHIAAAAKKEEFVKNLVNRLSRENLTAENNVGNTALTYAAAAGNVKIAKVMLEKNPDLPNLGSGVKPLFMAASLGHSQMVQFLYSQTKEIVCGWDENEQAKLFITCGESDLYGQLK